MNKERVHIQFWMSPEKTAELNENVRRSGLTRSAYLRAVSTARMPRENPPREYYAMMNELHALGNNLNQLTKIAHVTNSISTPEIEELAENIRELTLKIDREIRSPHHIELSVKVKKEPSHHEGS